MVKAEVLILLNKIRGKDFQKQYEKIKTLDTEQLLSDYIEIKLKNILLHAHNHVPYFNHLLTEMQIIEENNVSVFYTAPTAIRMFMKFGNEYLKKYYL